METLNIDKFNEKMRIRTKNMAVSVYTMLSRKKLNFMSRSIVTQLIRCSSSVAANFRSAARGRSDAEFYSKRCIVVEECDETLFWIDFLIDAEIMEESEVVIHRNEAQELLKIFSTIKRKLKAKRAG